jgi:hypothetical protein
MDINTDGSQEVSIEEFVAKVGSSIAQLGVEDFGQFICNLFVLGIHELRHQDSGKEPGKVIELGCEFFEILIGEVTTFETIKICIVDGPMSEYEIPHL